MQRLFVLVLLAVSLIACGASPTPAPDAVATRVAEIKAVAGTLTAEAPARTRIPTDTTTPTSAATPTPTLTNTPPPTNTPGPTGTPTQTYTPSPTRTPQPTNTPKPSGTPTPQPVTFRGVKGYRSGGGSYYQLLGEVVNNSGGEVSFVKILATFCDSADRPVASEWTYSLMQTLGPGEAAPFDILTEDPARKIDHYKLQLDFDLDGYGRAPIEVLNFRGSYSSWGTFYDIVGEVRNNQKFAIEHPEIIATCYNAKGKVVGANSTFADINVLQPGQSSVFQLTIVSPPAQVHHCTLQTDALRH